MRGIARGLLAMLALGGAAACAQGQAEVVDCENFRQTPSQYGQQFDGRAGQRGQPEFTFICHATMAGRAQLIYARMAQQQAASPAVKEFAGQVVDAQREMSVRLTHIAIEHEGVTPPRGLDAPHLARRDQLARLSGSAFDRLYLESAVQDGEAMIALSRKEVSSGAEPVISEFAAKALPALEQRAAQAQSLLAQTGS